jgi:hypothetical protein
MPIKIYAITGAPNTRKSSVIRALTGVRNTATFDVQFVSGITKTHVMVTSCNEINYGQFPNGITPEQLIAIINNLPASVKAVIIALRSSKPVNGILADVYIETLHQAGFQIMPVIMFNDPIVLPQGVQGISMSSNNRIPSNLTAAEIRKIWGIV